MSYAVETKKRKFHRVLESISKPLPSDGTPKTPNPTASTSLGRPISEALPAKKARLSGRSDSQASRFRRSSLNGARLARATDSTMPSGPSFVPWDRERFLERLETFRRVDRWTPKPAAINEVEWAKRGWICTDVLRVTCVGDCGGSVVVKLPDEIDDLDGYDSEKAQERKEIRMCLCASLRPSANRCWPGAKLVEEYSRLLVDGHMEKCPWRHRGCDGICVYISNMGIFLIGD